MNNQSKIIITGLVLIGVLVFAWNISKKGTNTEQSKDKSTDSTGLMVEDSAIDASARTGTQSVAVPMVVFARPGYVVVHENNVGQPGSVIGSSILIKAGKFQNLSVPLSRKVIKGETLYVMLHADNGDGIYSETDQPILGKNGEALMMIVIVDDEGTTTPGAVSL